MHYSFIFFHKLYFFFSLVYYFVSKSIFFSFILSSFFIITYLDLELEVCCWIHYYKREVWSFKFDVWAPRSACLKGEIGFWIWDCWQEKRRETQEKRRVKRREVTLFYIREIVLQTERHSLYREIVSTYFTSVNQQPKDKLLHIVHPQ